MHIQNHDPISHMNYNLLIVVPTYNEAENIPKLISQITSCMPKAHILIIDDGSADGTPEYIKQHKAFNQRVFMIERPRKLGLGTAYITGFKWGLQKNVYDAIFQMDADLSHNPEYLLPMLNKLQNFDLIIGSRYIKGGAVQNWSIIRKCISRCGSLYARFILCLKIKDLTGGFNLWATKALKEIPLDSIKSEGYAFQIELKYRASQNKFRITEYPIIFKDRIDGVSKMSLKIFIEAFYRVIQMRFKKI